MLKKWPSRHVSSIFTHQSGRVCIHRVIIRHNQGNPKPQLFKK
jgi:hypothetical protein